MLIPSGYPGSMPSEASLSRRVNANSQHGWQAIRDVFKLIKKGEC